MDPMIDQHCKRCERRHDVDEACPLACPFMNGAGERCALRLGHKTECSWSECYKIEQRQRQTIVDVANVRALAMLVEAFNEPLSDETRGVLRAEMERRARGERP